MHSLMLALTAVTGFGANPGALDMYEYAPASAPTNAPLVVVMHGCTQTAADIEHIGWDTLADMYGFYVVYPQQRSANNPIECFNWAGEYGDTANLVRGMGENESIKEMVDKAKMLHSIDPNRVFVTGFSAGAAMVPVMLATWPDVFAAGAIMSGIPYRCATTVNGAYACQQIAMHSELKHTPAEWGDLVRNADPGFTGPWPRVAIFHGTNDSTVSPDNLTELVKQWTNVLGTDQTADDVTMIGAHTRKRYVQGGETVVETYEITGMGHAVAMGADPDHACPPMGGSYIEDRGLCAPYRAATFFGIIAPPPPPPGGADAGPTPPGTPDAGPGPVQPGAPSVTIDSPGDGSDVSGAVTIEASASADRGIARVEFYVDGSLLGSDGSAPYTQTWQTANYDPGAHTIKAIAFDPYEVSGSTMVSVTIGDGSGNGAGGGLKDPIPCGCATTRGHGAEGTALGTILLGGVALVLVRRRR